MIVFGHNNFHIKSFTASELNIPQEEGGNEISFEVRQRYAHIFWIPFFPIGKIWGMRRAGDSNLYQMPEEIKTLIKTQMGGVGTPWYSYSIFILLMAAGAIYFLNDLQKEQRWEDRFYDRQAENNLLIEYPTTGDCYILDRYEESGKRYGSDRIILKVKEYNEDKIQFVSMYEDLYTDIEYPDRNNYHKLFEVAELKNFNPTYIDKEDLKMALKQEYDEYSDAVELLPLKGYFRLEKIDRKELVIP